MVQITTLKCNVYVDFDCTNTDIFSAITQENVANFAETKYSYVSEGNFSVQIAVSDLLKITSYESQAASLQYMLRLSAA